MTEITRVPLQPIASGALSKLWIGIVAVAIAGAGLAWAVLPDFVVLDGGVTVVTVSEGDGGSPTDDDVAIINYTGKLEDGTVFDEGTQAPLPLQGVIPGFTEGLKQMQKGGKYTLMIPSEEAYGPAPPPGSPIPADADLTFDIELLDFMPMQVFQQRMQMMRQLQEMQGASPHGDMPPAP